MGGGLTELTVNLASDVSLEASDDFLLGSALACSFRDIVSRYRVSVHSDEGDGVDGLVELAVAAAI